MIKINKTLAQIPPYVPGKPIEALERELGIRNAIKLASNENRLGPSKKGMAALRSSIAEIYRYPDGGVFLLRNALAETWGVGPDQVIVGNGSDEILSLLTRALLMPGDETIMADPSFVIYDLATRAAHSKPVLVPLTQGRHDLTQMAAAVTGKTKIIFICNPNNPTGTIVRRKEVERFLSRLPKHILVVFDEAYGEYATDPDFPRSEHFLKSRADQPSIIFLRTFSKIYGLAGLRVGYGIGTPDLIDLLNRIRQPFNVNLLAQRAAVAALSDPTHVKKSVEMNEKGKRYLYRQFDAMGISYFPTEANFIYFNLPSAKTVYDALLRKGVIIRHLEDGGLRVTIGNNSEIKRFIRSLRDIMEEI